MMHSTFIQVPDVNNKEELTRFLHRIVEILDVAFGNRGDTPLATLDDVISQATTLAGLKEDVNQLDKRFVKLDSSNIKRTLQYPDSVAIQDNNSLVSINLLKSATPTISLSHLSSTNTNDIVAKINEIIDVLNGTHIIKS